LGTLEAAFAGAGVTEGAYRSFLGITSWRLPKCNRELDLGAHRR